LEGVCSPTGGGRDEKRKTNLIASHRGGLGESYHGEERLGKWRDEGRFPLGLRGTKKVTPLKESLSEQRVLGQKLPMQGS